MEKNNITCVACPVSCEIEVEISRGQIKKIKGFQCVQGKKYAVEEFSQPLRILPATVRVENGLLPLVPVKSQEPIPRDLLEQAMLELARIKLVAPVQEGQVVMKNIMNTGVDMVATRNMPAGEKN